MTHPDESVEFAARHMDEVLSGKPDPLALAGAHALLRAALARSALPQGAQEAVAWAVVDKDGKIAHASWLRQDCEAFRSSVEDIGDDHFKPFRVVPLYHAPVVAVEAEMEACAKVCDAQEQEALYQAGRRIGEPHSSDWMLRATGCRDCAAAIRALPPGGAKGRRA